MVVEEVRSLPEEAQRAYREGRDAIRIPGTTKIRALLTNEELVEDFEKKAVRIGTALRLSRNLRHEFARRAFADKQVPTETKLEPDREAHLAFTKIILEPPRDRVNILEDKPPSETWQRDKLGYQ